MVMVAGEKSVARRQKLWKMIAVTVGMLTMILLSTFEVIGLLEASLALSCALIFSRCISLQQAEKAIQGDLIVLIAAAFSLGTALDQTGAASVIADSLISLLAPLGGGGILAGYVRHGLPWSGIKGGGRRRVQVRYRTVC